MENNWKEKIKELITEHLSTRDDKEIEYIMLEVMNSVFESTKKECTNKAQILENENYFKSERLDVENSIDRESILNVDKSNIILK